MYLVDGHFRLLKKLKHAGFERRSARSIGRHAEPHIDIAARINLRRRRAHLARRNRQGLDQDVIGIAGRFVFERAFDSDVADKSTDDIIGNISFC